MSITILLAAALAAQGPAPRAGDAHSALEPLSHARLKSELHALADAHAHAALVSIGRSRQGRAIEGLRLGSDADAPAILLVANLAGPRVFATATALDHARRLADDYATDERVRALLDSTTVYVLPCGNPDANELCVDALRGAAPRFEHRATGHGVDDDRDGAQGEDAPADVDGDGVIAWMRVPDPEGTWMADPSDPRAQVEADPVKGERGRWRMVVEGRDADGDDEVGEDPLLDAQVNRNFAAGWEPYTAEAGLFPTDEPEALALADFLVTTPELALVVTYDALDNLVEKPKTIADDARPVKRIPPAGVLASDGKLLGELGERYRELTEADAKGTGDNKGTFQRFAYEHRGLMTLNVALWELPQEDPKAPEEPAEDEGAAGDAAADAEEGAPEEKPKRGKQDKPKPTADAKRLAWIDARADESWRFVPWKAYEHPELGSVEIGGFAPFSGLVPPAEAGREIAAAHYEHLLTLGALLPRVALTECAMESLGAGVWRVTAVLENDSYLPLFTRSGRRTNTTRPARLELVLPEAAELLAGRRRELIEDLPGGGGRREVEWLVRGPEGMEVGVRVDTDHAGADERKAEVTR